MDSQNNLKKYCFYLNLFSAYAIMMYTSLIAIAALISGAVAHGNIATPPARPVGSAMKSVCGSVVSSLLSSDINTNQQQLEQVRTVMIFLSDLNNTCVIYRTAASKEAATP